MERSSRAIDALNLPVTDTSSPSPSPHRFADGGHYRVEIPSTEGMLALEAALAEADKLGCPVHRFSQGSGVQMLSDSELREIAALSAERRVEFCPFVTPRANFDTGALWSAPAGKAIGWQVRGADQLRYCLDDVYRAVDLGIRSVLVSDIGLLEMLGELKRQKLLPANLVIKTSALMAPANPASVRLFATLGACTVNVATDLSVAALASIRRANPIPLDVYIEAPDGLGGFVRHHEAPDIVRFAAPIYVKLGLRNSPDIYPAGHHLSPTVVALSRERVRRSRLVLDLIAREYPEARVSPIGSDDLGIPVSC